MKRIKLTQGKYALVDDSDYEELSKYKWHARYNICTDSFYAMRTSPRRKGKHYGIYMHRQILGLERGGKRQGDHRNHNTLDNRQINLRICTSQQNHRNRKPRSDTTSKYKGIYWNKRDKKWLASITINGEPKYLGCFEQEEKAALAYDDAAKKHFGKFACLNFKEVMV